VRNLRPILHGFGGLRSEPDALRPSDEAAAGARAAAVAIDAAALV